MRTYNENQNFNVVVSTKSTLIGAAASDFVVTYAPVSDLTNKSIVAGGLIEAIESIATPHEALLSANAPYGSSVLNVNTGHNITSGDVIEYATGLFAYVTKAMDTKLYLRTKIRAALSSGATIVQAGNTGLYRTSDIAIATGGEYFISIEAPEYAMFVESRVAIINESAAAIDGDAPIYNEVAVAY